MLALCAAATCAAEEPVRQLTTQALPFFHSPVPVLRHGHLVLWPPVGPSGSTNAVDRFWAYGRDGALIFDKTIDVAGGSQPSVIDVDFDPDGNAAVTASARGSGGPMQVILLLDRTGKQTGLFGTGRFVPMRIAFAPDRSIWALGWERSSDRPGMPSADYGIVRHFSVEGKEQGAYLPRSSFPPGLTPGGPAQTHIEVAGDRLGILVVSGNTSRNAEWIEMDLNGNVVERLRVDDVTHQIAVAALTADGHVYLGGINGDLHTLDRPSQTWKPVEKPKGSFLGADGSNLVYSIQSRDGPIQLEWFNQP